MSDEIAVTVDDTFDVAVAGNPSVVAHTHPASEINDSTTAGRAVLTAATVADQRVALGLDTTANQSFTATGSGTSRAVQDKLKDVISVKDFGAVGDGTTDDRSAISLAFTAANGATVLFPPGTYRVASALSAASGSRAYLVAGASFSTNTPSGVDYYYENRNSTAVAATTMAVERLFERSFHSIVDEAGIWSGKSAAYMGVSKAFSNTDGTANAPVSTLFVFANNDGSSADVVGTLSDAVANVNGKTVFAGNFIARNAGGTSNTKLVGIEIDVEPAVGTTDTSGSAGLIYNVFSIASNACVSLAGGISGSWANGHITSHIRGAHYSINAGDPTTAICFIDTTAGTFSSAAIQLGKGAAQGINFGAGSFGTSPYVYSDTGNNFRINMGSSDYIVFQKNTGADAYIFQGNGTFNLTAGGAIQISNTQVLSTRKTGWTAATGTATKSTFVTSTVTTEQLAERVKALIDDLLSHGLIGA